MAADCPDRPMQRRTAAASRTTSRPSTQARPPSGCRRVVRMRTAVVLPAPFGPSTPSTVPRGTDRSIPRSARTSPNDLTRPSTRMAGPKLVCDTPTLPDRHPFTNLPAATDSGESITARLIRRPGRAEIIADPSRFSGRAPPDVKIHRVFWPNKICREIGVWRPGPAGGQGTERIFHTNAEPSTVITATDRNRVGYPPSRLTSGAAIAGASTCGPELAMLMIPRSLARPAADGSTWVTSAWSTDRYTPNPRPMIAAEAMATGQDGHSASMTAGTAMTRPDTVTGSLRRPVRSETTPPVTAVRTTATV